MVEFPLFGYNIYNMIKDNILWFDIEGSDLPVHKARIISISFIFNGSTKTLYINPGVPINPSASFVNGFYDKDVQNFKPFSFYAPTIMQLLERSGSYGGYNNTSYDIPLLYVELLRCGYTMPERPTLDVYQDTQSLYKSLKLKDIYRTIFNEDFKAHQSLDDIIATKRLYEYIQNKLK